MIRRLIILLLIVGCVFGDTIVYKSGSKNRTIENVEYIKAGNGKVYFKAHGGEVSRDCSKVVTFTDNVGNPINYDCSVLIDEPLKVLEDEFEHYFVRIHRNALVAKEKIDRLETVDSSVHVLYLKGLDEGMSVSRRHLPSVRKLMRGL